MQNCMTFKVKPRVNCGVLELRGCCENLCNNEPVTLIICDCIPRDPELRVVFMDGDTPFELCDEGGHALYADQIYERMVLRCNAATDTMRLSAHNRYAGCGYERYPLRRSCHTYPFVKCADACGNGG